MDALLSDVSAEEQGAEAAKAKRPIGVRLISAYALLNAVWSLSILYEVRAGFPSLPENARQMASQNWAMLLMGRLGVMLVLIAIAILLWRLRSLAIVFLELVVVSQLPALLAGLPGKGATPTVGAVIHWALSVGWLVSLGYTSELWWRGLLAGWPHRPASPEAVPGRRKQEGFHFRFLQVLGFLYVYLAYHYVRRLFG